VTNDKDENIKMIATRMQTRPINALPVCVATLPQQALEKSSGRPQRVRLLTFAPPHAKRLSANVGFRWFHYPKEALWPRLAIPAEAFRFREEGGGHTQLPDGMLRQ
jgi:hypothetical protein